MMPAADSTPSGGPKPLVRCLGCDRSWHGAIVAHGLKVTGRCPRCSGELSFRVASGGLEAAPPELEAVSDLPPSQILGVTTTWDR